METQRSAYLSALDDFDRLHRRAALERLWGGVNGQRSNELLSYEAVSRQLKITGRSSSGVQDISLDAIVGSVGRYNDFTRNFLPKRNTGRERWARVRASAEEMAGWPPIQVYQVGNAYFVLDGNHRVSVARDLGVKTIQADVTEIRTRVLLAPADTPDDIIAKAEYAEFLEETRLDELAPDANLRLTIAHGYPQLREHIIVHRHYMGLEEQREIPFGEAVAHWYEVVYLPIVEMIRASGLLRRFPDRTEADLYLWIARNQTDLAQELGLEITPENVVLGLAAQETDAAKPGAWYEGLASTRRDITRFDLLVPVNGQEIGWNALEQALVMAARAPVRLHGLHVVATTSQAAAPESEAVKTTFEERCRTAGVDGKLVIAVGEVVKEVKRRARWTDLIVVNLAHPPSGGVLEKLRPGFRSLVRQTAWPMLVTPSHTSPLTRPLLAFDGSRNSVQALYLVTYLAGRWQLPLTVVTVTEGMRVSRDTQRLPKDYFHAHGIAREQVTFLEEEGPVGPAILRAVELYECDWIVMGSFSRRGIGDVVGDSALDVVLRSSWWPMLICR
ncbi:MAG TPA: universal stress protein [Anaerolineae bacterium]|nr:universal stress protein [Anaerolineae bacterium]